MVAFALVLALQAPPDYSFVVDGKPDTPFIRSLQGTPARPAPGDVVYIRRVPIVLEGPGTYRFKTTPKKDGRLLRIGDDGSERVAGVSLGWEYEGDKKVFHDPLSRLTAEEIGALRGVHLDGWTEGTDKRLALLDPAKAIVVVTDDTHQTGKLRPLPPGLRYLEIEESSNSGIRDLSSLAAQRELRFFQANLMTVDSFDVALIRENAELRYLDLGGKELKNAEALSSLKSLRVLDLAWNDELKDVRFASAMKSLVALDIRRSGVEDLSPLEGLPELAAVEADVAPIRTLPKKVPALKTLRVMSTRLADADVAAFRAAHPGCRVHHRWDEALRDGTAGVDRIRVRSGGTCHRSPGEEKTLADVKGEKEVRGLIDHLKIDEAKSSFHCMCCGEPSFEFYRGADLVATIGFHHGQSLRWSSGWPGDGLMTEECAEYVAAWLAQRGIEGPAREREEEKRREQAMRRRWDRYRAILPEGAYEGLRGAKSREEAVKALESAGADGVARAKVYLRLFGCDEVSWNLYAGLDEILKDDLLPKLDAATLSAAVSGAGKEGAGGVGRWLFHEERWKKVGAETRKDWLPTAARWGLASPREETRARTLRALLEMNDALAVEPLREFMAGDARPRALSEEEKSEPGGQVVMHPGHPDLPEGAGDPAVAAYILARLGDRPSLDRIRALRDKAKDADRPLLDKAAKLLER